ncbi:hypothetical protein ASPWEDRAFT_176318 [Aspergillus wentii DTO 134E9]|uniref:SMODS and SLOG-associating 2TM effector domain-containing protein n=1 Tax=Aspergillus wentii DTO 134E9 TaxID=1073089 RepID=A0A1L9R8L2_ASPWE|nr:uncharacterized protein ASPWEDRAFT_176318 [Aspergillus wentii DTO 134E9]OJJ31228.1 hypothetical protein ASPWEDRAFT_176318 [Aspergillus wentii DTO 134E9]
MSNGRGRSLIWRLMAAFEPEEPDYPRLSSHPNALGYPPIPHPNAQEEDVYQQSYPTSYQKSPEQSRDPSHSDPRAHRINVATTNAGSLIPPGDKLLVFRALTGIDSVPALTIPHHNPRTAVNVGIYARVVSAEQKVAKRYRFFSILINTCLGIQIVVAAALTALGAASGPHSAVTAFGAINTIMAGILTYLKGSGLPDRLKHYQNEWRNIREYIEQREREFCLDGCLLDVQEEIQIVESMYEGVKREIEATKSGEHSNNSGGSNRRAFFPTSHNAQPNAPQRGESHSPISVPEPSLEKH